MDTLWHLLDNDLHRAIAEDYNPVDYWIKRAGEIDLTKIAPYDDEGGGEKINA